MSFSHENATDSYDNSLVVIKGGTDNTSIGNVGDRLKVYPPASVQDINETFEAYSPATAPALNKSMFSIFNSSASTLVKIRSIYLTNAQSVAVTGAMLNFELRRITGHSAGTLLTPFPYDLNTTLVNITTRTGSTVVGEDNIIRRWIWSSDEHGVGTLDQEGYDYGFQVMFPIFKQENSCAPLLLRQNQGITLKQTINSTVGAWDINVIFTQE